MRSKRRGYGLMESVISMSIASLLVTALTTVVPGALLANFKSRETYRASAFAQSVLEECQGRPFSQLKAAAGTVSQTVDGRRIQGRVQVLDVPGQNPALLQCVHVDLEWREMGQPRKLSREVWVVNSES